MSTRHSVPRPKAHRALSPRQGERQKRRRTVPGASIRSRSTSTAPVKRLPPASGARLGYSRLCGALVALFTVPAAAQVVPAGTTATTAVTAASGKVTVSIAPVVRDGISHNTYLRFNVPVAGVDLNNSGIGARTIVTQATCAAPSRIQGPLAVTGPPAHVILANPNGVTVDGGSFVNTSRVVISTGVVSFVDRNPTPLTTQRT